MGRHFTFDDETTYVSVNIEDALTTVRVYDTETGQVGRAHALWFREDAYDENLGIKIAYSRAITRLSRKLEKYWIKQTKSRSY